MSQRLSLWLLADDARQIGFASQIRALADAHRSPLFEPHVTLLSRLGVDARLAGDIAATLAREHREIVAQPTGFDCESIYWRFMYIKLANNEALVDLYRTACARFARPLQTFTPHLSLMYAEPNRQQFEKISATLDQSLLQDFKLTVLALVELADKPSDWTIAERFPLTS